MSEAPPRPTIMTDLQLQNRCLLAGKEYADMMYPGYTDLQVKTQLQNAVAAGYSKGFRDAEKEFLEKAKINEC